MWKELNTIISMENIGNITIIEAESRFKKVDKSIIENPKIDCLTLGIYTKLIVLGKKWNLNVKGLKSHLSLSDEKIRKALLLLEEEGYLLRTPIRNEKGQCLGWNYTIFPTPIDENERSKCGCKKEDSRPTTFPTTRFSDHSDLGGDNNIRLKETKDLNKKEEEKGNKVIGEWRVDFCAYLELVNEAKEKLIKDSEVRAKKEKYYPNIDYELSLEKMIEDFWGTEQGWKHKVKSSKKSSTIDMVATLKKGFDMSANRVYKRSGAGQNTPAKPYRDSANPKPADKTNKDGTFYKDGFRYYHSMRDNLDYSIPLNAPPMPSIDMEYDPLNKEWYNPSSIETHGLW